MPGAALPPRPPDGLSDEELRACAATLEATTQAAVVEKQRRADDPLGWPMRVLILVGICCTIWVPIYYASQGMKMKARQSWIYIGYSFALWLGLGILVRILANLSQ